MAFPHIHFVSNFMTIGECIYNFCSTKVLLGRGLITGIYFFYPIGLYITHNLKAVVHRINIFLPSAVSKGAQKQSLSLTQMLSAGPHAGYSGVGGKKHSGQLPTQSLASPNTSRATLLYSRNYFKRLIPLQFFADGEYRCVGDIR